MEKIGVYTTKTFSKNLDIAKLNRNIFMAVYILLEVTIQASRTISDRFVFQVSTESDQRLMIYNYRHPLTSAAHMGRKGPRGRPAQTLLASRHYLS